MSGSLYTRSTKSMLFCSHHSFFVFRYARNSFGESIKRLGKIQIKVAASSGLISNSAKMLRLCLISAKDCCSNIGDIVNNSFISSALTFSKFASAVISVGDIIFSLFFTNLCDFFLRKFYFWHIVELRVFSAKF